MARRIPIFFASDDNYVPYLAVTVKSIADHASEGNIYDIKVLTSGLTEENTKRLASMKTHAIDVEIVNINEAITNHRGSLRKRLRDYYSESIFYRIFIASLFPKLERAIYIDCDIVLVDDIAKLYDIDLGDNILGAVADESIPSVPEFCTYVERWVGVPRNEYINSGVLLLNLTEFRRAGIEKRITELSSAYNFDTVAPDQDYLNFLCRGRIKYLDLSWNKQPKADNPIPVSELHLIHYNMFNKPWHYEGVLYEEEFWRVADTTPYREELRSTLKNYTDGERRQDLEGAAMLVSNAARLTYAEGGFNETLGDKNK
ncbi:MAG: glycosyltransferase family 8 protein [Clostridia bacterium]|nr:glycosyltransferase family 8 protein [Clostridia bacterium]